MPGRYCEKLVERNTAFSDKQRTMGAKAFLELVHPKQNPSMQAAFDLNGDGPTASLQDKIHFKRPLSPVMQTECRTPQY